MKITRRQVKMIKRYFAAIRKVVSLIVIAALLLQINGCYYYKAVKKTDSPEMVLSDPENGNFYILHMGDSVWQIKNLVLYGDYMEADISELEGHSYYMDTDYNSPNRFKKKYESEVLNEVHIWAQSMTSPAPDKAKLNYNEVQSIVIYDMAVGAVVGSWVLSSALIATGASAIFLGILLLLKSSCPFIYVHDGQDYLLAGEIYSGAIYPSLEREDYLLLDNLSDTDSTYRLMITNEIREIQHTNLLELYYVDHSSETVVMFNKYGQLHTLTDPFSPSSATNLSGEDILHAISSRDSFSYFGGDLRPGATPTDGMILEFDVPDGTENVKISLRAKNSFWLEYVYKSFHDMLGSRYNGYTEMKSKQDREILLQEMMDHQLPVSVYTETNNEWVFSDYFNLAGPMALKEDILSIPAGDIVAGKIRIKLEYGSFFWEIDHVSMDLSEDLALPYNRVSLKSAVDEQGRNVLELLARDDDQYYVQPEIGNAAKLEFPIPDQISEERTLVLHSKGFYRIIRNPEGKPQLRNLKRMKREGGLPYLSNSLADEDKLLKRPE